jgi:hypothetical protein
MYITSPFYRRVKSNAAVNWFLVKANRCSSLKVVNKKSKLWDRKLILLAAVGYVLGLENLWCFRTGPEVRGEGC